MRTALAQLRPAWLRGVPGAVAGLFLARVALEAAQRPWPGSVVLGGGLLAAVGGFALGRRLTRHSDPSDTRHPPFIVPHWPFLILLIYVLWPRRDFLVAASAATLTALTYVVAHGERSMIPKWAEGLVDGVTFVVFSLAYLVTAAPDVLPADAGEFQLAAALLGVAHPPGYPLYTLIGHLFIRLIPWGTPAYRLNLLSGLLAAGTLVLMARATRVWARRLGGSPLVTIGSGLAAALTLGAATTFWAQATIANVRTLAVFLAALALYALSRFATAADQREADRALILLSIGLGLGAGHYPPLAFVGLFFVVYVLLINPGLIVQPRRWWRPLAAGVCAFLLPLAYLPIRGAMDAPLAPEGLDTLSGFLHHFLARGFAGDMFAFANPTDLPHRLALVPTLFLFQFNTGLIVAALLGLLGLAWRDWRLFVMLAGSLAVHTFVTVTYRAPQTVEYLMPAYLPVAAAVGLLPALLQHSRAAIFLCSLILVAGLLNGWSHAPSFVELSQDRTARETVEPLLDTAPSGALLLADWRWAMPLRYLREVEGQRPDVELQYVWPVAGEDYRDVWLDRVQNADPERPVLLTHAYDFDGYTTEPWESGFLIRPRPLAEPAAPLAPIGRTFGGQVRLIGYALQEDRLYPGQTTELNLAWQPTKPLTTQPSFTLRLVDDKGQLHAQVDRALSADVAAGEVRFERLVVPLYPTLSPGQYQMTLGAYIVTDAGFEALPLDDEKTSITLAEVELVPLRTRPFTQNRQTLPFKNGPMLVGVDYDRSAPEVLRVYLHWQGPAQAALEARVRTGDGAEATASLPAIPPTAYQTIAVDLPLSDPQAGSRAIGSPRLSLTDPQRGTIPASGPWGWPLKEVRLPTPTNGTRFVPLGDEMAVIGAQTQPVGPGETMALDVTLVALRPLTSDDATSARLADGDGRWLDTHDCQPGLGAVPTLKWIRGSRVVDRHLLEIPEGFSGDSFRATMVAYERFRMAPLPSMDPRFSEAPLGTWNAP
jgi:hypothetical protein